MLETPVAVTVQVPLGRMVCCWTGVTCWQIVGSSPGGERLQGEFPLSGLGVAGLPLSCAQEED